jgi:hypothetical protein
VPSIGSKLLAVGGVARRMKRWRFPDGTSAETCAQYSLGSLSDNRVTKPIEEPSLTHLGGASKGGAHV